MTYCFPRHILSRAGNQGDFKKMRKHCHRAHNLEVLQVFERTRKHTIQDREKLFD
jgi:hypothetical protein